MSADISSHGRPLLGFGRALPPKHVYIAIVAPPELLLSLAFTTFGIYQVQSAGLNPLQLVLIGTVLEATVFLAEAPTGVFADTVSRRVSVIVGMAMTGIGLLTIGLYPGFGVIALGQVFWGLGVTFHSGAREAWLADEIGEEEAAPIYLRASQARLMAQFAGIPLGVLFSNVSLTLPFYVGGGLFVAVILLLLLTMGERGFTRSRDGERGAWASAGGTLRSGARALKGRPALITILLVAATYGMSSEAFDRLEPIHFLDSFEFPGVAGLDEVEWFGILRGGALLGGIAATEVVRRRTDLRNPRAIVLALTVVTLLMMGFAFLFALAGSFWFALLGFWCVRWVRSTLHPVLLAWLNRGLDPRSRATVVSMLGQSDAIGQVAGGPVLGVVGTLQTVRFALVCAGLVLVPALALYGRALRRGGAAGNGAGKEKGAEDV